MSEVYIGIDPGKSGGICTYCPTNSHIDYVKMPDAVHGMFTYLDNIIKQCRLADSPTPKVVLEKVHSMPGQGVASTFTFGQGYGQLQGVIAALGLQCIEVIPNKWMKCIGSMPKDKSERKKFIKDWVEKRSGQSIPLYVADAVAIAYVAPTLWGDSK
jgi:crossover junction endodeoxyribonuclease RuvC